MTEQEIEAIWLRVTGFDAAGDEADIIGFARALLAAGASEGQAEKFKPVGRCECAFSQDECEVCEANREAYQEHLAERDAPVAWRFQWREKGAKEWSGNWQAQICQPFFSGPQVYEYLTEALFPESTLTALRARIAGMEKDAGEIEKAVRAALDKRTIDDGTIRALESCVADIVAAIAKEPKQ